MVQNFGNTLKLCTGNFTFLGLSLLYFEHSGNTLKLCNFTIHFFGYHYYILNIIGQLIIFGVNIHGAVNNDGYNIIFVKKT